MIGASAVDRSPIGSAASGRHRLSDHLAFFTVLTARAGTLQEFVIFRFLTGLGLGG
jgi:hypothetical protein